MGFRWTANGSIRNVNSVKWFGYFDSLNRWLELKLKIDAYELQGDEIVRSIRPKQRVRVQDIHKWQVIYIGGGVPFVCFQFVDGRTFDWSDRYEQLFQILQKVAAEKELPFTHF